MLRCAVCFLVLALVACRPAYADFPSVAGQPRAWTGWDELAASMRQREAYSGPFAGDLFEASDALGRCPGWFDAFPRFLRSFDRLCGRGILLKRAETKYRELTDCLVQFDPLNPGLSLDSVRKCDKVKTTMQQARDAAAIQRGQGGDALDEETRERHEALLGSVKSLLTDVAVCTIKAGITAADMPEARRRDWERFVDGARVVESGLDIVDTYYGLAEKVAKDGQLAFIENFTPGSVLEWDEAVRDAEGWTRGQVDDFFAPFGAAAGRVRDLFESFPVVRTGLLRSEVADVTYQLESCRFDQALKDQEVTRLKLETMILRYRRDMAFYRHRTNCAWREQGLDGVSLYRQNQFLTGVYSPYKAWGRAQEDHQRLLELYESFRKDFSEAKVNERRRVFEERLTRAVGEFRPHLERRIRDCDRPGGGPSLEVLQAALWSKRQALAADACGEALQEAMDRLIARADRFLTLSNRANSALADLGVCRIGPARRMVEAEVAATRGVRLSELEQMGMDACWGGSPADALRRIEQRAAELAKELRGIDGLLQRLQRKALACDDQGLDPLNRDIETALDALDCPIAHPAVASRRDRLGGLNDYLRHPECTPSEAPPAEVVFPVRISGSGFTPHYAGGSYVLDGHHDIRFRLPYGKDARRTISEYRERFNTDPCKTEIPAIPGLSKIPVLFNGKPGMQVLSRPRAGSRLPGVELENTWKSAENDGPSLGELRGGCR